LHARAFTRAIPRFRTAGSAMHVRARSHAQVGPGWHVLAQAMAAPALRPPSGCPRPPPRLRRQVRSGTPSHTLRRNALQSARRSGCVRSERTHSNGPVGLGRHTEVTCIDSRHRYRSSSAGTNARTHERTHTVGLSTRAPAHLRGHSLTRSHMNSLTHTRTHSHTRSRTHSLRRATH
jgi:hypothetical protein